MSFQTFSKKHPISYFDGPSNYLYLFKNHRQTFSWPGERPSSRFKVTKMWFGPNIKYLSEPFFTDFCCREGISCLIWFGVIFGVTVLTFLCSWCSLSKVKDNQGFYSYSRYNLLAIAIKTVFLRNVCKHIFPTLSNTLYCKNSKYTIWNIETRGATSFCMRLCKQMVKIMRETENVK